MIGSGAGGGTLGNELALNGIRTVILEAGGGTRSRISSTTSGRASPSSPGRTCAPPRAAGGSPSDFPNLPAWIVKAVGGSTTHWAGASLRFQEHEFKARTTYGDIPGANLLDWPITLADLEPYYAKAEDQDGRDPHQRHPRPARQQQLQGARNRAPSGSVTRASIPAAWRSTPSIATSGRDVSRPVSASRAASSVRNGRRSTRRFPEGEDDRKARSSTKQPGAADRARRGRQGDGGRLRRQGRQAATPKGAHRCGGGQLDREPAAAAQFGILEIPRRSRQQLRTGRTQLHAAHDGLGLRGVRQAGAHVARHDDGGHRPG